MFLPIVIILVWLAPFVSCIRTRTLDSSSSRSDEMLQFSTALETAMEDWVLAQQYANVLGALEKDIIELDDKTTADEISQELTSFFDDVGDVLRSQRDLIEKTYLQPSDNEPCLVTNGLETDEYPLDLRAHCLFRIPGSMDNMSPAFVEWAHVLMSPSSEGGFDKENPSLAWQYFGDGENGKYEGDDLCMYR